ncbi:hypothetical protein [Bifidobacterium saguinibicoloris]|uniref:hypothetical protein n=1 Tax=Bifidobacterium saguinibicoloris TaxID=2834433 RepID=UPI001C5A5A4E|nr:hypothetical protein [Bifidobacterium saguinibicoloris]MBW3081193.1 hypothetical protein [Bifidobacterium saguinibicoloris]
MKKKIMAILAAIVAVLSFGFASNTAFAASYGATVTVSGNTATVSFPAGTFEPNEAVTVTWDDNTVSDVQQIGERTFSAKADGSLTLRYVFKPGQEGKTIKVTVTGAVSGTHTASVTMPATGAGDQSATSSTGKATIAQTGAAIAPYGLAVVLLVAAGFAMFVVRKTTSHR